MPNAEETKIVQQEYKWFYPIFLGLTLIVSGIVIGGYLFGSSNPILEGNMLSYITNLWTEAVSIGITVVVLDRIYSYRNTKTQRELLLKQLIREMGSYDNGTAIRAIEAIKDEGWLTNGTLSGLRWKFPNLEGTNLQRANFKSSQLLGANLQYVSAYHVNFENARLDSSDLKYGKFNVANCKNASFPYVDMRYADFRYVNFENAYLPEADLENANLTNVNFKGANLFEANLQGADVKQAIFDETTTLPSGRYWSKDTDLSRFTDLHHSDFWRPDDMSWLDYDDDTPAPWWLRDQERLSTDY